MVTAGARVPTVARRLVRSTDQVDVLVELFDATVDGDDVVPDGPDPSLRLTFGSQHTAEDGFPGTVPTVPSAPVAHVVAGESVVVAPIAAPFPFTVEDVLALADPGTIEADGARVEATTSVAYREVIPSPAAW